LGLQPQGWSLKLTPQLIRKLSVVSVARNSVLMLKLSSMSITIEQCRAARALLNWSAAELAEQAKVGIATIRRFEGGLAVQAASKEALKGALEASGVTFIDGGDVSPIGGVGARLTIP
jgi:hypothetical protein